VETDYEALKTGLQSAIPFNDHLGIRYLEVGPGRAVAELPSEPHLMNHVGTQHAGGLFTAGEAASGGAFLAAFVEQMGSIMPLAEGADIRYKKIARGPIRAEARFTSDLPALLAGLETDGRVRFPVEVELRDESDELVAEMTVRWYVKRVG
jgi:acyl-coenzyme A thioesterase PaaI-like protein